MLAIIQNFGKVSGFRCNVVKLGTITQSNTGFKCLCYYLNNVPCLPNVNLEQEYIDCFDI